MKKIKIFLVDDHTIFRQGIRLLLNLQSDLEVIGEADNGAQAVLMVQQLNPDVVLMDIAMKGMDGLTATKDILAVSPKTKVVLLTQHENKEYILPALKIGAAGYVLKRAAADEVVNAIRATYQGRSFLDPEIADIVVNAYRQGSEDAYESLTEREREILILLAKGHTNNEIAPILNISPKTVDYHRSNLMKKLKLHSKVELTKYALKRGLIQS
ncbi:response regulator transcription factor [Desulfosporosinus sp.]|uniref:response regulator n=1 Tax=Desulfosporosinus sp. TaxID=157907 RepID=UPI000E935D10|nr:response regulator transcription factor [Desulfosporosinus sp.]MBC2727445.1 response regulator transcription factor [Desulfosporosinus sp.]MCO5388032.1 response regulator transcription factor [Desulfosporosinus sp.]HBV87072.1 DNA-binding response regulator [Desulfosporosinus sp.]